MASPTRRSSGRSTAADLFVGMGMKDRQSIRKRGHDYGAPGDYFVTVCVRNRDPLLGGIEGEAMVLSEMGLIVQEEWQVLPERFPTVHLDELTIMPNHLHGIITLVGAPLAGARPVDQPGGVIRGHSQTSRCGSPTVRAGASPAPTLGAVMGAFKSLSDRRCRQVVIERNLGRRFGHLWQRDYHDHIVADHAELERIREYIRSNTRTWRNDPNYVSDGTKSANSNMSMHLIGASRPPEDGRPRCPVR